MEPIQKIIPLLFVELHALLPLVALEGDDVHEVVLGHLHLLVSAQLQDS